MSVQLNEWQQATQAEHNKRHPGKICRTCPVEVAHRDDIARLADRLFARSLFYRDIVIGSAVLVTVVLLWLFVL